MKYFYGLIISLLFLSSCQEEWSGSVAWSTTNTGLPGRVHSICFIDDTLGFACGGHRFNNAFILKSTNGGSSWQEVLDDRTQPGLYDITFYNKKHGIAVGYSGRVWRTSDGGNTWAMWQHQSFNYFQKAFLLDSLNFILLEGDGFNSGSVYYPSGSNWWVTSPIDFDVSLTSGFQFSDGSFLAAGYGAMFSSPDGIAWQPLDVKGDFYLDVDFLLDEERGFACGFDGSLLKTDDGGRAWQTVKNTSRAFTGTESFYAIDMHDNGHGLVVGLGNAVRFSDNYGEDWFKVKPSVEDNFFSVATPNGNRFYLGAEDGKIYEASFR